MVYHKRVLAVASKIKREYDTEVKPHRKLAIRGNGYQRGADVRNLQQSVNYLIDHGWAYTEVKKLSTDGVYGRNTDAQVRRMAQAMGVILIRGITEYVQKIICRDIWRTRAQHKRAEKWKRKNTGSRGRALVLYRACLKISNQHRSYVYGGGHGPLFRNFTSHGGLDCSSSTGYGLWLAKIWDQPYAVTSGQMAHMFEPGPGKYITIYANADHVWIRFRGLGRYWRFDTSPWGSGGDGPRMRITPRSTRGFVARHPKGL